MSAYFVADRTVDAAVGLLCRAGQGLPLFGAPDRSIPPSMPDLLGRNLLALNLAAMIARYRISESELADYRAAIDGYRYTAPNEDAPILCKSLDCLLYQCSEGDIDKVPAFQAVQALANAIRPADATPAAPYVSAARRAYNAAPWGLE